MSDTERLRLTLDALARLSCDPTETPERRARADAALELAMSAHPETPKSLGPKRTGNHSGGHQLGADARYEGWTTT